MDVNTIQALIQGGAIGISFVLIWVVYKLAANHINHNTEVLTELKGVISRNNEVVGELSDVIKKKF